MTIIGVMRGTISIESKGVDPPLCERGGGRHCEKRPGWIQGTLSSDLLRCKLDYNSTRLAMLTGIEMLN